MAELTMRTAIRKRCLNCSGFDAKEVRECDRKDCKLYPYRMGKMPKYGSKERSKAVSDYCLECCNNSIYERARCTATTCPMWTFKTGKRKSE